MSRNYKFYDIRSKFSELQKDLIEDGKIKQH